MRQQELLDKRIAFVRRIVDRCEDIGKTKMQKISYFLQESVGVPLMYPFKMHHYGPYSDDLDRTLSLSESLGFIDIKPDWNGFGYHVTPSQEEGTWSQEYNISEDPNIEQIDQAIGTLVTLETYELELYATIHFVGGPGTKRSKEQTMEIVRKLKPKFTNEQIGAAYEFLKKEHFI